MPSDGQLSFKKICLWSKLIKNPLRFVQEDTSETKYENTDRCHSLWKGKIIFYNINATISFTSSKPSSKYLPNKYILFQCRSEHNEKNWFHSTPVFWNALLLMVPLRTYAI